MQQSNSFGPGNKVFRGMLFRGMLMNAGDGRRMWATSESTVGGHRPQHRAAANPLATLLR
jgi:hypothetical protein